MAGEDGDALLPPQIDCVEPLPQPVPLELLPPSVAWSPDSAGSRWSSLAPSNDADGAISPTRPPGFSDARYVDMARSEEDEVHTGIWPPPTDTATPDELSDSGPPAQGKKPSMWKRALSGKWRNKDGVRSRPAWSSASATADPDSRQPRLNSKTPQHLLPSTWAEYRKAYAARLIDIDDPPLPPTNGPGADGEAVPAETGAFFAPRPSNEILRQNVLNRLDLLGTAHDDSVHHPTVPSADLEPGSIAASDVCQPTPKEAFGPSLRNHPAFRRIVAFARQTFHTDFSLLSIFDNDQQIFLAESGLGEMAAIPRDIGFCAHTLLSSTKGLVILDTLNDFRFSKTPLVTKYGSRFYAGVPLLAPQGAVPVKGRLMPIGTLCIVDTKPRKSFGDIERRKLIGLANYARNEIDAWHRSRTDSKLAGMDRNFRLLVQKLPPRTSNRTMALEAVTEAPAEGSPPLSDTPAAPMTVAANVQPQHSASVTEETAAVVPTTDLAPPATSATDPISTAHHAFSMASRLIAASLDLDLVYLVRVDLLASDHRVSVVAYHGLSQTKQAHFDFDLHIKALRAPERGLLYQNPSVGQFKAEEQFPEQRFASALLVPVDEDETRGFVLAAYTVSPTRVFGAEDLAYMTEVAEELKILTEEIP